MLENNFLKHLYLKRYIMQEKSLGKQSYSKEINVYLTGLKKHIKMKNLNVKMIK
jgi:hypothetical protein